MTGLSPSAQPFVSQTVRDYLFKQVLADKINRRDLALELVFLNRPMLSHDYVDAFRASTLDNVQEQDFMHQAKAHEINRSDISDSVKWNRWQRLQSQSQQRYLKTLQRASLLLTETLSAYFKMGADPNAKDGQGTPLVSKLISNEPQGFHKSVFSVINSPFFHQPNASDRLGRTPLMIALMVGDAEAAHALLNKGASVVQKNAKTKELAWVRDKVGFSALDYAKHYGQKDMIKALLAATENSLTPSQQKTIRKQFGAQWLLNQSVRKHYETKLSEATKRELLCRTGAPAAYIKALLAAGADVHARPVRNHNQTCLHALIAEPDNMRLLIAAGADINAQDDEGQTPLHLATHHPAESTALLISVGADVNARTHSNSASGSHCTPLHFAVLAGNLAVAKLLTSAGAKVDVTALKGERLNLPGEFILEGGENGLTPLDMAKQLGNQEMITLLAQAEKQQKQAHTSSGK